MSNAPSPPRKILIGSQRDPADPKLSPSKPKPVRVASQTPPATDAEEKATDEANAADAKEAALDSPPEHAEPDVRTESTVNTDSAVGAAPPAELAASVQSGGEVSGSGAQPPADPPTATEPAAAASAEELDETDVPAEPPPVMLSQEDFEKELDDAMAGVSFEDLISTDAAAEVSEQLEEGSRHKATVVKIHRDDIFFSLRGRHQGVTSLRQFKQPPKIGAQMDVVVNRLNAEDGLYDLHIPGASIAVADWDDLSDGAVVEARVTGANTGGLECLVNNIRGFIPASQISMFRVDNLSEYINEKLQCVITEVNPQRQNLVLSHRAILERERSENRQKILDELEVGQVREGTVTKIMDFGAFVDIGGIDGLVHISKLSWDRVDHPSEVLKDGQQVRVKVEKVDKQTGKIGLSYRDLLEDPWDTVEQQFSVGSVVTGTVSRTANFGAFVKLAPGVEGLIHISELAHSRVASVNNVVSEGQEVQVKVLSIDREAQRIGLSLKATIDKPAPESKTAEPEADEPARQPIIPKSGKPLRGGTGTATGGDQFGLKW